MKIKFLPTGQEIEANPNKTLLQLCTENNIEIRSICKGVPSCAECRVRITAGENNLIPPNRAELSLIGTNYYLDGRRLSCQVRCFGDITVDLTEQIERTDNPNKKVRGFRAQDKTQETKAVQGTLVLEEKPAKDGHAPQGEGASGNPSGEQRPPREAREHREPREPREPRQPREPREQRPQQQGQGGGGAQGGQPRGEKQEGGGGGGGGNRGRRGGRGRRR